jgi:hypothetical protein
MRAEGSVLCRDAKTGRSIASLSKGGGSVAHMGRSLTIPENATVRERARRTYLQDWLARIAAWMHEKESASFSSARYPSNAPSPIMLL